jgi:hypothetical protein
MEQWQRDGFARLERSGYLKAFSEMARHMCVPFWWSEQPAGEDPVILQNGTICLVATPERTFGVTADHVYAKYLDDLANRPDVECQFGSGTIKPEYREIGRDAALDLATFDFPEVALSRGAYFHRPYRWPPEALKAGELVLHGGYPQVLRNPRTGEVDFGFQWFISRVNDANEERISLEPDAEHVYWPDHEGEQINQDWGGQSGGPVYRVIDASAEAGEALDRLELVGFIYNRLGDLVLARPARFVNADGTIHLPDLPIGL